MFTGIIQAVGKIEALTPVEGDMQLDINVADLDLSTANLGDSIAVNGVCLTAIRFTDNGFVADVSAETLSKTCLGDYKKGSRVNLEKALTPATPLGGHLVSGHVDGIGEVVSRQTSARSVEFTICAPDELAKYIAQKGSICVDGISLTVNQVSGAEFKLNIVPHTLSETTMADFHAGHKVNLEVDLIARYLERLMLGDHAADAENSGISADFLAKHGFIK